MTDQNDDIENDDLQDEPEQLDEQQDDELDAPDHDDDDGNSDGEPAGKMFDEAYVRKLRQEAARTRRESKAAIAAARREGEESGRDEFARDLYESLGLGDEDDEFDVDEVVNAAHQRANEADARLRAYEIKDAVTDAAREAGADTSLLIPYLRGKGLLDELDPSEDDFQELVSEIVDEAVTKNPKLKADVPTARRSGGDMSGGNGSTKSKAPSTIDDLRAARRKWRESRFG